MGFSAKWVKLRKEAGFKSAYEFYSKNGGAKVLKMSFVNLWRMERGKFLPKPERMALLTGCLRGVPDPRAIQDLALTYHKELLGPDAHAWITRILFQEHKESQRFGTTHQASRQLVRQRLHHLNYAQHQAIFHDYAAYWAWVLFSSDKTAWKAKEIAAMIEATPKETAQALKRLVQVKMIKIQPDGSYWCPFAGRHNFRLPFRVIQDDSLAKAMAYQARMVKSRGRLTHRHHFVVRAQETQFQNYYTHLTESVQAASAYSVTEKAEGSALFLVEGNIHRLFPY